MRPRQAFTLVELLIVLAIIGVLAGLLLPAIQAAREAARRAACRSNLRQIAIAIHDYHEVHGVIPPLYNGKKDLLAGLLIGLEAHSWRTVLLPFIEQKPLYQALDLDEYATHPKNQPYITVVLPLHLCPSTPRTSLVARGLWTGRGKLDMALNAAVTDYNASEGFIEGDECLQGAWGEVTPAETPFDPPIVRTMKFKSIVDGLSNTALLVERAGLPDRYWDAGNRFEPHEPPAFRTWGNVGLWALGAEKMLNHMKIQGNAPIVNGDNLHGLFSFHPGGAHVAMVDGAVRFLREDATVKTIKALVIPDDGETANPNEMH